MSLYSDIQKIDIGHAINPFVQYFKDTKELKEKTLMINLRFTASDFKNNQNFHQEVYLLYHSPYNYTTVAWTDKDLYELESGNVKEVKFEVCHDSCWRDGTERIIKQIAQEAEKQLGEKSKAYVFNSFGIFNIKLLDIKLQGDYDTGIAKVYINNK